MPGPVAARLLGVVSVGGAHRLCGEGELVELANAFLAHLGVRDFSPATVRGYAYDLLNFGRFLAEADLGLATLSPVELFSWLDWQTNAAGRCPTAPGSGPAPSTINRRVAAVRGLFEYAVMTRARLDNPVPAPRRSSGLRARRGLLGHVASRPDRRGGRLVRQPRRLPEALSPEEVAEFLSDLRTHRDRAMVLAMATGGLRSAEVRGLPLADIDLGLCRLRVLGKGAKERVVPVDDAFFAELAAYLGTERPRGCRSPACFVVLHGPTRGQRLSEDGLRKIFRTHRATSGVARARPHRLRHTYASELAAAGMDLLVLRELMGHASPEATSIYVHLSPEVLAAQYAAARSKDRQ